MNKKELYVLLDEEGDVCETFSSNSNFDYMFQLKQAKYPNSSLHKATLLIGEKQSERIQTNSEKAKVVNSIKTTSKNKCFQCHYEFDHRGFKVFIDDPDDQAFCTLQCMDVHMQKNDF